MLAWLTALLPYFTILAVTGGGIFSVVKWVDQRKREEEARRFEQYWKLIDVSQESPHLAKQQIALLLLKRFPDFKGETTAFLNAAKKYSVEKPQGDWYAENAHTIEEVLSALDP